MKQHKSGQSSVAHDAAVAAAAVAMEEFFGHYPNGVAAAIHERLSEIVEAAIEAALAERDAVALRPSAN